MTDKPIHFYKFLVNNQVFYKSKHTYALVNLKPLVPGHVLVVPYRTSVLRFGDLNPEESLDYMNTLQFVHKFIIHNYKADALNIAIQDGPESGQSIPHLHTHLIPRYKADGYGDDIYTKVEKMDLQQLYREFESRKDAFQKHTASGAPKELSVLDEDREVRTAKVMHEEAMWLADEIQKFSKI